MEEEAELAGCWGGAGAGERRTSLRLEGGAMTSGRGESGG